MRLGKVVVEGEDGEETHMAGEKLMVWPRQCITSRSKLLGPKLEIAFRIVLNVRRWWSCRPANLRWVLGERQAARGTKALFVR